MTALDNLKQDLKKQKPHYGIDMTVKKLRNDAVKKIYIASNCPDKETIRRYATLHHAELIELSETNTDLGVVCKRPHAISVLSFSE